MFPTSEELQNKLTNLEKKLSDPSLIANQREYKKIAQEHAQVKKLAALTGRCTKARDELEESNTIFSWRYGPAPAAMRRLFLSATFSGCTAAMLMRPAGASRS